MRPQRAAGLGLALSVALSLAGGCADEVFRCESATQCRNNGEDGTCQPNGFCSFPDDDCPSGLRYGAEAPDGLANICVEPEDVAGTDGVTTQCATGECSDSDLSSTAPTTSAGSTVGDTDTTTSGLPTTDPGATDPSETSATSATSEASAGSEGSASESTGPPNDCPQIVDEFDDGMLNDLIWTLVNAPAVSEASGTIRFAVDPQIGGMAGAQLPTVPFVDVTIRVDVVELSPLAEFPFRVELDAAAGTIEVSIDGTESVSVRLDGDTLASVPVANPVAGVSLEIVSTLGGVFVLAGPAGAASLDLLPLGKLGLQYTAAEVQLSLLAGNPTGVTADAPPFSVRVDHFSSCDTDG